MRPSVRCCRRCSDRASTPPRRPKRRTRAGPASAPPMSAASPPCLPGLVAGDIDLGPYIVALSPHRVVAAPYHRLEQGILANHAIMDGTPEQALRTHRGAGRRTTWRCARSRPATRVPRPRWAGTTLRARLLDGGRFAFLRELDFAGQCRHQGLEGRAGALTAASSVAQSGKRPFVFPTNSSETALGQ